MSMIREITWEEFRATGALWFLNRMLHAFGLVIVIVVEGDGTVSRAYPARTKFRGFDRESEEDGFRKLSTYVASEAETLRMEAHDEEPSTSTPTPG